MKEKWTITIAKPSIQAIMDGGRHDELEQTYYHKN